jgi:phosphoglycerate dehydrogenase-like enzyme
VDPIRVLVNAPLFEDAVPQIAAVDPRVEVTHIGRLMKAEAQGDAAASQTLDLLLSNAEIVAGMRLPNHLLQRAPHLKWVQLTSAGVDHILDDALRDSPIVLTNASNVHSFAIAEFALTSCLTLAKNVRECYRQKEQRLWEPYNTVILRNKTMGIVGFGHIGRRVARMAAAFEMRVVGLRRSLTQPGTARYAETVLPSSQMKQLLAESDFVVLTLPLTRETRHLIGAEELLAMKPSAFLVNVSRGPIVNELALAAALHDGTIAGAAMDVFAVEPLPRDNPLLDAPNFFYSPHIAGWLQEYPAMVLDVFLRNLGRYVKGQRLQSIIDKRKGY